MIKNLTEPQNAYLLGALISAIDALPLRCRNQALAALAAKSAGAPPEGAEAVRAVVDALLGPGRESQIRIAAETGSTRGG